MPRAVGHMVSATFPITCARSDVLLSALDFTQFGFSTSSRSFCKTWFVATRLWPFQVGLPVAGLRLCTLVALGVWALPNTYESWDRMRSCEPRSKGTSHAEPFGNRQFQCHKMWSQYQPVVMPVSRLFYFTNFTSISSVYRFLVCSFAISFLILLFLILSLTLTCKH